MDLPALTTNRRCPRKKVIGIIGGSGPEAGADLFGKILALHRKRLGHAYRSDRDAPDILLLSVSGIGGPRTARDIDPNDPNGTYKESLAALVEAVRTIVPLVDAFAVACNTIHMFEPHIRDTLLGLGCDPSVFVSMISSTTDACKELLLVGDGNGDGESGKVLILGGPVTMGDLDGTSVYGSLVHDLGADRVYRPPSAATSVVQRIIWQIKERGTVAADGAEFADYRDLLNDAASHGVRVAVLACTELPLIDHGSGVPGVVEFIDPTEVVAKALLDATQSYPT
jgi:aspartate racemase